MKPAKLPIAKAEWIRLRKELGLPPRQAEAVYLIACGLTDDQIAARMSVTIFTVRAHLKRAYVTLGVGSRTQLLALLFTALRNMLAEEDRA